MTIREFLVIQCLRAATCFIKIAHVIKEKPIGVRTGLAPGRKGRAA